MSSAALKRWGTQTNNAQMQYIKSWSSLSPIHSLTCYLPMHLSVCLSIHLSIYLPFPLSVRELQISKNGLRVIQMWLVTSLKMCVLEMCLFVSLLEQMQGPDQAWISKRKARVITILRKSDVLIQRTQKIVMLIDCRLIADGWLIDWPLLIL